MSFSATVNTKTILRNIKQLRSHLNPGVKFCAVLKANAYGFGDMQIARVINPVADFYAVATIQEAVRLRTGAQVKKPILLLGVCQDIEAAVKHNLTITIGSVNEMETLIKKATGLIYIHIKVNTGLNRYGITTLWQLKHILTLAQKNPRIIVGGLYTHMSHEKNNLCEIDKQLKKFTPFRSMIKRNFPRAIIHASCSGSAEYKPAQFDMVRVGKSMYGGFNGYKTCLQLIARIVAVQNVAKSGGVGYGHKFTTTKSTPVGIVSCGYADCGFLNFGTTTYVAIGKKRVKILGTVGMDAFMVDVSGIQNPLGKPVTIISPAEGTSFMEFVKTSGKSACLQFCSLNYTRGKLIYK